ncbi:unnamed protein product, partial [Musa hybrid cultivar]
RGLGLRAQVAKSVGFAGAAAASQVSLCLVSRPKACTFCFDCEVKKQGSAPQLGE